MGNKSKSQADRTTTNVNEEVVFNNVDNSLGNGDRLNLNASRSTVSGNTITLERTDFGAIDAGLEAVKRALGMGESTVDRSLDFGEEAFDFAENGQGLAFGFGENALDEAGDVSRAAINSNTQALDRSLDFGEEAIDANVYTTNMALEANSGLAELVSEGFIDATEQTQQLQGQAVSAVKDLAKIVQGGKDALTQISDKIIPAVAIISVVAGAAIIARKSNG